MRTTTLGLLFWLFFPHISFSQHDILIKDVHVVHADKGEIQKSVSVHIANGLIQKLGKVNEQALPKSTTIVEAEGKYLMHGMIDAHVHFFQSGGLYTRPDAIDLRKVVPYEEEQAWLRENASDLMKRYTAAGITHLCDVGGPMQNFATRDQANTLDTAPQLFVTGPLISTYQPDAFKITDPPIVKINNPDEARALVQKQLPFKPDFIKIWYIVGLGQTAEQNLPIVEATIEESHKNGVKVAVHATQLETARLAVKAGADILVHSVDDKIVDDAFVQLLADNQVSYIPTLIVSNNYNKAFSKSYPFSAEDFMFANPHTIADIQDLQHIAEKDLPPYFARLRRMAYYPRKNEELMGKNLKKI
ncbi:MAG: amidohydrolase, partial [Bacteroidota bacterium]